MRITSFGIALVLIPALLSACGSLAQLSAQAGTNPTPATNMEVTAFAGALTITLQII